MKYFIKALKNYATFSGRARRSEYWYFFLFNFIFSLIIGFIGSFLETTIPGTIYSFLMLLPGFAVAVRRMHDVGKSGWVLLIPLYNIVLLFSEGSKGSNKYGPDPKAFCFTCNINNKEGEIICAQCGSDLINNQILEGENQNSKLDDIYRKTIFQLLLLLAVHYFLELCWFVIVKFIVPVWFSSYDGTISYDGQEVYQFFGWASNILILTMLLIFAFLSKNNAARILLFILFTLKLLMVIGYEFDYFYNLIF